MLLVEVPADIQQEWLLANEQKAKMNPMLSNFDNMIRTGKLYATLRCTHFVEAQKLVMEGGRRWRDQPDGTLFQLKEDDVEGKLIQANGVEAIVYEERLWWDKKTQLALMRMGNLNDAELADIQTGETELDGFGHVSQTVSDLTADLPDNGEKTLSADDVLKHKGVVRNESI